MKKIITLLCAVSSALLAETTLLFSPEDMLTWQPKRFTGETTYILQTEPFSYLEAMPTNTGSASGLFYEEVLDIQTTPYLQWTWRINAPYDMADETAKAGDDFGARVYVVVRRGAFGLKSRAINYVYANHSAEGAVWTNPFVAASKMVAASTAAAHQPGDWHRVCRNVMADFDTMHGLAITEIDAVAVMSDNDNHGDQGMRAGFGAIGLVAACDEHPAYP